MTGGELSCIASGSNGHGLNVSDSFKASERTHYQRRPAKRDWERYAHALDLRLGGATLLDIGLELGVTAKRAGEIVEVGRKQLAYNLGWIE